MAYRFNIKYEFDGRSGSRFILAATEREAWEKWEADFSWLAPRSHAWIDERWAINY